VLIQVASVENLGENPKAKKGPGRGIILDNKIDFLSGITMPYTAMADSAVTCWLPMTAISHDMGPLKIIPGSHREVWKVRFRRDLAGQSFAGPKRIEMANPDIENFERRSIEVTPMQPGDTLLFHGRLLDCSGDNQSARYRWICNPRFGDLTDPKLVKQSWTVSRSRNPFAFGDYHPEQVASDS